MNAKYTRCLGQGASASVGEGLAPPGVAGSGVHGPDAVSPLCRTSPTPGGASPSPTGASDAPNLMRQEAR
jgi:hypothetical protein